MGLAPFAARECEGKCQSLLGPRHAHVAEPALFVDCVSLGFERPLVRQDAFFHADQIDVRKLQPLGRVHRHQGDGVVLQLIFFVVAAVAGSQCEVVEKASQRRLAGMLLIVGRGVDDFLQRGGPRLAVVGVRIGSFQFPMVAGLVDHQ